METKKAKSPVPKKKSKIDILKKQANRAFMHDVDQWFGNMGKIKYPYSLEDANHEEFRLFRKEISDLGGKVTPVKDLPDLAAKAWKVLQKMNEEGLWEEMDDDAFYDLAAEKFFGAKTEKAKSPVKKTVPKKPAKKISAKRAPVAKISAEERKIASKYAVLIYKALAERDHILVSEDPAAFGDDFSYEEQFQSRLESIIEDYNLLSEEAKRVSSIRGNKKESWFQRAMKTLYGEEESYFELNQEPWLQILVEDFIEECEKVSVPKETVKSSKKAKAVKKVSLDSKGIRKALAKFAKSVNLSLQKTDDLDEINYAVFGRVGVLTVDNIYSQMNKDDLKEGFREAVKDFPIHTAVIFDPQFIYVTFAESPEKLEKCLEVFGNLSDTGLPPVVTSPKKAKTVPTEKKIYVVVFILLELPEPDVNVFSTRQQAIDYIGKQARKHKNGKGFKPDPKENVFSFDDYFYQIFEKKIE
jgi:hypothetical protein